MSSLLGPLVNLTTRRYTLPDKTVASQVLMYRQLLHTECKFGLRLSRGFEGTEAQRTVMHMPWWEQGVEQSKKMVISYSNLIVRLWLNGAIMPYVEGGYASAHSNSKSPKDDDILSPMKSLKMPTNDDDNTNVAEEGSPNLLSNDTESNNVPIDTLINEKGLPPIPHPYWVDRLGFQQTDPITDFRSGGVLSLAMIVYLIEACPKVHSRFLPSGDTHMLPYGITCINVTDMIAEFCMFKKSIDRVDALLSQKPFWRMFEDPNAILVLQELCVDMLCDVVVEMGRERNIPKDGKESQNKSFHGQTGENVSVFDFSEILSRTEKRVRDDLLGAGPKSVAELRLIHARINGKYIKTLEKKEGYARKKLLQGSDTSIRNSVLALPKKPFRATLSMTENVIDSAGGVWQKYKENISDSFNSIGKGKSNTKGKNYVEEEQEVIDFATPPNYSSEASISVSSLDASKAAFSESKPTATNVKDLLDNDSSFQADKFEGDDNDVAAFTIDDDDDDNDDLLS